VRRKSFENKFQSIIEEDRRKKRKSRSSLEHTSSFPLVDPFTIFYTSEFHVTRSDGAGGRRVVVRGRPIPSTNHSPDEVTNGNALEVARILAIPWKTCRPLILRNLQKTPNA
jgi:1-acyl-sn-glycerol-3-phosphate acyltransferase